MKKRRIVIPLLLFIVFILTRNIFSVKEVNPEQTLSKETEQSIMLTYPTFIGDEGVLDATKATTTSRTETREKVTTDTEVAHIDKLEENIIEEEAQEVTDLEEVTEQEEVLTTSSEVEESEKKLKKKKVNQKKKKLKKNKLTFQNLL